MLKARRRLVRLPRKWRTRKFEVKTVGWQILGFSAECDTGIPQSRVVSKEGIEGPFKRERNLGEGQLKYSLKR